MPLIKIKNISKKFLCRKSAQPLEILKDANIEVESGRKVAIRGPSGSGKSTLLYILGLLARPDGGSYQWHDDDLLNLNRDDRADFRRKNLGFVFQNYGLLDGYSVLDNVLMGLKYSDFDGTTRRYRAEEILEKVGLWPRRWHYPRELSGGECQRLGLARALIGRPALFLADEPTGNLDEKNSGSILGLFEDFNRSGGTLIIVTHNREVAGFCHERWALENGGLYRE